MFKCNTVLFEPELCCSIAHMVLTDLFVSLSNLIQIGSWGSAGGSVCCSTKQRGEQEECGASLAVHFLQTHTHATHIRKR